MIGRWEQHFDAHLSGEENIGTEDQGNGGNDYVSAAEDEVGATPTLREEKGAYLSVQNQKANKRGMAPEFSKMGPEKLSTCLYRSVRI